MTPFLYLWGFLVLLAAPRGLFGSATARRV